MYSATSTELFLLLDNLSMQPGFSGTVSVTAIVESEGDKLYDGLTSSVFTIVAENTAPPEFLVQSSTAELKEGSPLTVRVALSKTSPTEDVTVTVHPSWIEGIPRDIDLSPTTVVFPAGSTQQWREITVKAPYSPAYHGKAELELVLTSFSDDPLYSSISGVGLTPGSISLVAEDIDTVGVCLSNCALVTKYDFMFAESAIEPVETPYEVLDGAVSVPHGHKYRLLVRVVRGDISSLTLLLNNAPQAELKFKLRTQPLGDIQLLIEAVFVDDGSAAVVLPAQARSLSDGSPLSLPFSTSTWSDTSRALLQV